MPSGAKTPPGPFSQEIAAILRAKIARDQIPQLAISHAVGISQSQLSAILGGKKHADIEQLDELCWVLGLKLVDVFREADEKLNLRQTQPSWTAKQLVD